MDGGAWWAAVHGVARNRTRLSDFTLTFHFHALEMCRQIQQEEEEKQRLQNEVRQLTEKLARTLATSCEEVTHWKRP